MSNMSEDPTLKDMAPPKAKEKMPLSRILLLLVLLIAIVLLIIDYRARSGAAAADVTLQEMIQKGDNMREQVHEAMHREPSEEYETRTLKVEVYSWRGVFRSYKVYAGYRKGNVELLEIVNLNERLGVPPEGGE